MARKRKTLDSVGVDLETFSELDITKVGAYKYARHPSTELLLLRAIVDDEHGNEVARVEWELGDPRPDYLFRLAARGIMFRAFNAAFEWQVMYYVCCERMGWPVIPLEQWYCTQGAALRHNLAPDLQTSAKAFNKEYAKMEAGTRLINKFSKPRKPTKNNPSTRNYKEDAPEDWEQFGEYCLGDVLSERELYWGLPCREYPEEERKYWLQLQRQNEYGFHVDLDSVNAINDMLIWNRENQLAKLEKITDGAAQTDGQRDVILAWSKAQGYPMKDYTKASVEAALDDPETPESVRQVMSIRADLGQTSTAKYPAFINVACDDSRVRGGIVYHRASTGRNGGALVQPHNFPRDYVHTDEKFVELCLQWIHEENYEDVRLAFGQPTEVAKGLLRPMITATPGKIFYVADYASIENRVTVWIARDPVGLEVFAHGKDQYTAFVANQFGIREEDVTPEQRTDGKATILGAMFGAGWRTIHRTNVEKGIPMTKEQAKTNVNEFREQYKITAKTWYELDECCVQAVSNPSKKVRYKGLQFFMLDRFFCIRLHSGRLLMYCDARVQWVKTPWGQDKQAVVYMGLGKPKQWIRQTLTPSRIIENIVQATARDLLMYSKDVLIQSDFYPVLDVHDELVMEQDPDFMEMEDFNKLMEIVPEWGLESHGAFVDLPVKAEGYKAVRYRK